MSPFDPPCSPYNKNNIWVEIAKPEFINPNRLWRDYWQRFNTITIPMQDEDAYFADAVAAARLAQNREHLEELLAEKYEERREFLEALIRKIGFESFLLPRAFPSQAARRATMKVARTGSLDSFIQVASGVVFGWNDDDKVDELPEASTAQTPGDCRVGNEDGNNSNTRYDDDAQDDEDDFMGDPFEYENQNPFPPPAVWEDWEDGVDDAHNDTSWKVNECESDDDEGGDDRKEGNGTRVDKQPSPSTLTDNQEGRRSQEIEPVPEDRTTELPIADGAPATCTSEAPPTTHVSSPRPRPRPPPTPQLTDESPSPSSDDPIPATVTPKPSNPAFTNTPQISPIAPPDVVDKPLIDPGLRTRQETGDTSGYGLQGGGLSTSPESIGKRRFFESSGDECEDGGGREGRKRRAVMDGANS